jgi:hypothetical protein
MSDSKRELCSSTWSTHSAHLCPHEVTRLAGGILAEAHTAVTKQMLQWICTFARWQGSTSYFTGEKTRVTLLSEAPSPHRDSHLPGKSLSCSLGLPEGWKVPRPGTGKESTHTHVHTRTCIHTNTHTHTGHLSHREQEGSGRGQAATSFLASVATLDTQSSRQSKGCLSLSLSLSFCLSVCLSVYGCFLYLPLLSGVSESSAYVEVSFPFVAFQWVRHKNQRETKWNTKDVSGHLLVVGSIRMYFS